MSERDGKAALRTKMRAIRDAIPKADRDRAAAAIASTLVETLADAGTVMAFLSFSTELPTDEIVRRLHEAGHTIAIPHIDGPVVIPVAYAPGDPVELATFGIREPADIRPVDASSIDAVLVPGLAFDTAGFRVGYGGGFYDKLLLTLRPDARRIGICFEAQVVDGVPIESFDLPVQAIITEMRSIEVPD